MQSSARAKHMFLVTFLVLAFLLQGITDGVLADTPHVETVGWKVHAGVDTDQCSDVEVLDYSSCSNGPHCPNCYAAVWRISIVINSSSETLAPRKPVPHLQIDDPPQLKPPRIS